MSVTSTLAQTKNQEIAICFHDKEQQQNKQTKTSKQMVILILRFVTIYNVITYEVSLCLFYLSWRIRWDSCCLEQKNQLKILKQ